jgi:hypothetical protein
MAPDAVVSARAGGTARQAHGNGEGMGSRAFDGARAAVCALGPPTVSSGPSAAIHDVDAAAAISAAHHPPIRPEIARDGHGAVGDDVLARSASTRKLRGVKPVPCSTRRRVFVGGTGGNLGDARALPGGKSPVSSRTSRRVAGRRAGGPRDQSSASRAKAPARIASTIRPDSVHYAWTAVTIEHAQRLGRGHPARRWHAWSGGAGHWLKVHVDGRASSTRRRAQG